MDPEIETQFNQLTIENTGKAQNPVLVYSEDFSKIQDKMPRILQRATLVFELIKAYNLFEKLQIKAPQSITANELAIFHSKDYIQSIFQAENGSLTNSQAFGYQTRCYFTFDREMPKCTTVVQTEHDLLNPKFNYS